MHANLTECMQMSIARIKLHAYGTGTIESCTSAKRRNQDFSQLLCGQDKSVSLKMQHIRT